MLLFKSWYLSWNRLKPMHNIVHVLLKRSITTEAIYKSSHSTIGFKTYKCAEFRRRNIIYADSHIKIPPQSVSSHSAAKYPDVDVLIDQCHNLPAVPNSAIPYELINRFYSVFPRAEVVNVIVLHASKRYESYQEVSSLLTGDGLMTTEEVIRIEAVCSPLVEHRETPRFKLILRGPRRNLQLRSRLMPSGDLSAHLLDSQKGAHWQLCSLDAARKAYDHLARCLEDPAIVIQPGIVEDLGAEAIRYLNQKEPVHQIEELSVYHSTRRTESTPTIISAAHRIFQDFGRTYVPSMNELASRKTHRVFVALGSNLGDRIGTIEKACKEMERRGILIRRTSSLFETAPMYVTDQDPFINGVCEAETNLKPLELLDALQSVEKSLGRDRTVDKGPRTIDLDILLYDYNTVSDKRLTVPHKLMLEREFVLRPLCDLIPHERLPEPNSDWSFDFYLNALPSADKPCPRITPVSSMSPPLMPTDPTRRTQVMAVLNVTPDSFSDGGIHSPADLSALENTIHNFISAGANIIDVGGQSTRPSAPSVSEEEELARVIPVIKHMRSMPEARNIAISIDTFLANVASDAVKAGTDIINDVSAGTMDNRMLSAMAKSGKTVILMHMRGTPETMNKLTFYPTGIIDGVGTELLARVTAAETAGIRRWRIILDPGIGFAKTQAQNLELIRNLHKLREFEGLQGFPWLVGTSRKGFIGRITGVEKADERGWGTAAAVTASIQGGADLVRVHDVQEMGQVVKMADAIFREDMLGVQDKHE